MENSEELKPCPFCGGAGLVQIAPNVRGLKKCPHCGGNGRVCVSSKPERLDTSTPCVSQNGKELDTSGSCTESLQAAPKPTYEELEKMVKPLEWLESNIQKAKYASFAKGAWLGIHERLGQHILQIDNRILEYCGTLEEAEKAAQEWYINLVADALGVERSK